jgi:hypothetical protein
VEHARPFTVNQWWCVRADIGTGGTAFKPPSHDCTKKHQACPAHHKGVEIRARVSGYLDRIDFVDGQMVRQGDHGALRVGL